MRNFLLGVAVGATGMGLYTGYIKVDVHDKIKKDVEDVKTKVEGEAHDGPQSEEEGRVG